MNGIALALFGSPNMISLTCLAEHENNIKKITSHDFTSFALIFKRSSFVEGLGVPECRRAHFVCYKPLLT